MLGGGANINFERGGTPMKYVGIDYHKKYSHVAALNEMGEVICSRRLENRAETFQAFFRDLKEPSEAVLEASRTWGVMFDLLEGLPEIHSVTLAHPQKVRAIAEAKIKTDKIDAHILAQLLRADLIPAAYIPGKETRLLREMVRQRVFLVRTRTRLKNRIHVLLDRLHVLLPSVTDLFGKRGTDYLKKLKLGGSDGEILREDLELLDVLNQLIRDSERELHRFGQSAPRVKRLLTVPGIGPVLALVVALEIEDIERFGSSAKLVSYSGLAPTTYSSGGKVFHGKLLPWCNKWLRWAFVEAAWIAVRQSPYCRYYFESRKRRLGAHSAAIALARRLAEIIWHVWKEQRDYEERSFRKPKPGLKMAISPAALTAN
jgi:transposase